jgi:hypothetical protein
MTRKNPSDFTNHDDWLAYVREEVPLSDQGFVLASGRLELYRNFYRLRQIEFPRRFTDELNRIETLCDPGRASALETLNSEILGSLTRRLSDRAQPAQFGNEAEVAPSLREQMGKLRNYLAQTNPYFALWLVYKRRAAARAGDENWNGYLVRELGSENAEEIAFAQAMSELDKLLGVFLDNNLALPDLAFERIWFLHYLRGPERMAQTRAVLGMLTAELAACTFA